VLTLYTVPVSLYCAKVRIALRHKGLTWQDAAPAGGYGSAEYKRLVPSGNLPALDHDGLLIGDSESINEYLDDYWPDPPMLPDTAAGRARVRDLSRFHDTRLEPALRALFAQVDPAKRDGAALPAQAEAVNARLSQLAQMLGDHPVDSGCTLTLGDCGFPVTARWIEEIGGLLGLDIDWPAPVRAYLDHVGTVAAVRDELAYYKPGIDDWLAMKTRA